MAEFNLIDEPWIPCIDPHGQLVEYGIRDTLLKAHELREICDDSPLVTAALHRLLLAMLYRAHDGPSDTAMWLALYERGRFEQHHRIGDYLKKWRTRFYLFDDRHPFMQVAGLDLNDYKKGGTAKKDKSDGLMRLAKEAPDKGGRVLFDHRMGTERPEYESKQIAKMILSTQSYAGTGVASAGRVGDQVIEPTACRFAPCVDGFVLWLQGDNLFQTLMLSLVPQKLSPKDLPAWEDSNIVSSAIRSWNCALSFTGPMQRYAPLSRFIRVVDHRSVFFTNGLKTTADSDDPMKAYYRESDARPYEAKKLLEHKAAWRDAHTLFAVGMANHKPPMSFDFAARLKSDGVIHPGAEFKATVLGLATRIDKGLFWRHERMPVPAALLADVNLIERLGGLLRDAEQVASDLNFRTRRTAKLYLAPHAEEPGGRKPDDKEVANLASKIDPRPAYWARLEKHFLALLENIPTDWDTASNDWKPDDQQAATNAWREYVKGEARRALEESIRSLGTTARAIQAVARVRTEFNNGDLMPQPQKAAKAR